MPGIVNILAHCHDAPGLVVYRLPACGIEAKEMLDWLIEKRVYANDKIDFSGITKLR
jgi:hypothetical protein